MTTELSAACSSTDPDEIVHLRAMLTACGVVAAEEDSPRCFLYEALSSALGRPSQGVDPMLLASVVSATGFQAGVVELVAEELTESAMAAGARTPTLLALLARELRMAAGAVAIDIASFDEELRHTDTPDDIA
jgi:hypothetical protein